jgi:hypothetical protein
LNYTKSNRIWKTQLKYIQSWFNNTQKKIISNSIFNNRFELKHIKKDFDCITIRCIVWERLNRWWVIVNWVRINHVVVVVHLLLQLGEKVCSCLGFWKIESIWYFNFMKLELKLKLKLKLNFESCGKRNERTSINLNFKEMLFRLFSFSFFKG